MRPALWVALFRRFVGGDDLFSALHGFQALDNLVILEALFTKPVDQVQKLSGRHCVHLPSRFLVRVCIYFTTRRTETQQQTMQPPLKKHIFSENPLDKGGRWVVKS